MKRYNRFWGGEWHFVADDEFDGLLLRVRGKLYVTDWGEQVDLGPEFMPEVPDIEVSQILPEGGSIAAGVLDESGIIEVITHYKKDGALYRIEVIDHASWDEIEILPNLELPHE